MATANLLGIRSCTYRLNKGRIFGVVGPSSFHLFAKNVGRKIIAASFQMDLKVANWMVGNIIVNNDSSVDLVAETDSQINM